VGICGAPIPKGRGGIAESTLEMGTEPPVAGLSVEVPVGTAEAPTGVAEASSEPSRKRKRGFPS
jgi:hypothetical protein